MSVGDVVTKGHHLLASVVAMARRPWRTPRLPELVGNAEACEILGIQKMTMKRWMQPGSGTHGPDHTYMIPPKRIKAGPVWVRDDVMRFRDDIGRQRAPAEPRERTPAA
jgi:hypothetical protein